MMIFSLKANKTNPVPLLMAQTFKSILIRSVLMKCNFSYTRTREHR